MTLPEVLVSVAITGIVGSLAFNLLTDFTRRAWEHEARTKAIDQRELAANMIRREVSQFIKSVTGPYGEDAPSADLWTCNSSLCEMKILYKYQDINGGSGSKELFPLKAECLDVSDARLALLPSDLGLHAKAKGSLGNTKCLECPAGKAPRLAVTMYKFDSTSGAPTLVDTKYFPQTVGKMSNQGSLAMGVCLDWPAYQYHNGIAVVPRYDRWEVTLITVYARFSQRGGMTAVEISDSLARSETKILVSPSRRLAPDFRYTPVK
jgi:hypothetical protein